MDQDTIYQIIKELHDRLGISQHKSRCYITRNKRGTRIVVIRLSDGMSAAQFIPEGEGQDIPAAEADAWAQWQKIVSCPAHEFERQGYKNGVGFCKHCGLFLSRAFDPEYKCVVCQRPTNHATDIDGNHYCEQHASLIPEDKKDTI